MILQQLLAFGKMDNSVMAVLGDTEDVPNDPG